VFDWTVKLQYLFLGMELRTTRSKIPFQADTSANVCSLGLSNKKRNQKKFVIYYISALQGKGFSQIAGEAVSLFGLVQ